MAEFSLCFFGIGAPGLLEKVSLKLDGSLERNLLNPDDIILLNINFENLVVELYVSIIFFILTKF